MNLHQVLTPMFSANSWWSLAFLLFVIVPFMLIETMRSMRNEYFLRQRGAIEPVDDVYRAMSVVYPATFIVMALEGAFHGGPRNVRAGLILFALAKLLKFWAIVTLGERWSFRVLVLRGAPLITGGPYRFFRHPNYIAVVWELVGAMIVMNAPIFGLISLVVFGSLLKVRIATEERALGLRSRHNVRG